MTTEAATRRSPYLDRIATENPADLIAEEVGRFRHHLLHHYPDNAFGLTPKEKAYNRVVAEAAMQELREIWRLAKRGDEAWRPRLHKLNTELRSYNKVVNKHWELIILYSPRKDA